MSHLLFFFFWCICDIIVAFLQKLANKKKGGFI